MSLAPEVRKPLPVSPEHVRPGYFVMDADHGSRMVSWLGSQLPSGKRLETFSFCFETGDERPAMVL